MFITRMSPYFWHTQARSTKHLFGKKTKEKMGHDFESFCTMWQTNADQLSCQGKVTIELNEYGKLYKSNKFSEAFSNGNNTFQLGAYSLSSVIELNEISITVTSLYVEYSLSRSRSIIHTFRCLWNGGKN